MKKKLIFFLLMLTLVPILASCTYINSLMNMSKKTTYPNSEITVNYYVDDELYKTETTAKRSSFKYPDDPTKDDYNFGGWTYKDSYQTLSPDDFLYNEATSLDLYAYFSKGTHYSDNLSYNGPYISTGVLPSYGSPKVLVVPVDLGGNTDTDEYGHSDMIGNINEAFNGTSETTGYESVNSYYKTASYGKLDIQFEVLNKWFTPAFNPSYYANYDYTKDKYYETGSGLILREFLDEYDDKIDFSQYDLDGDGYIDSVWLVYNVKPSYSTSSDFYWAYVTTSLNTNDKYDGKYAKYYGFASYYFMFEHDMEKEYDTTLELYDTSGITYDAHTYIHETGHLLGLADYYDTDASTGATGGIYTAGMMDSNRGDLNTVDKLLLGWVDPYVIYTNSDKTVSINPFSSTGDVILVSKVKPSSIYTEYFLFELYDNTGVDKIDNSIATPNSSAIKKSKNKAYYEYEYGIRILHINATLTNVSGSTTYDEPVKFLYNNSNTKKLFVDTIYEGSYATHNQKINKTTAKEVLNYYALYNGEGTTYKLSEYNTFSMTNGNNIFFNFTIDSISSDNATLTFSFV